jgi:DNA-binding response OmpR family regulator
MNLAQAREQVAKSPPDLIVLDIMLPDGSGLDFLAELKRGCDIPVLLLTALSETDDEIKGIQEGGDDYVAKPYSNELLLARINNILRQKEKADERVRAASMRALDTLKYGELTIDTVTHQAYLRGEDVNLTPKEFSLLAYFLKNIDKQLTPEEIYEAVWGQDANNAVGTVKVHIKRVRDKLKMEEGGTVVIETEQRKFYVCNVRRG